MDSILVILLVIAAVKLVFFGALLTYVFRGDIAEWRAHRKSATAISEQPVDPMCVYCGSKWTVALDEGQSRWEGQDLVLVTSFRCQHCDLPFWRVDRVHVGSLKTRQ
jgi:hypothetical protein